MSLLRRIPIHVLLFIAIVVTGFSAFLLFKVNNVEYLLIAVAVYGILTIFLAVRLLSSS